MSFINKLSLPVTTSHHIQEHKAKHSANFSQNYHSFLTRKMVKNKFCLYKAFPQHKLLLLFLLTLSTFFLPSFSSSSSLSFGFYADSCPVAEMTVKNTVRSASQLDPTVPGKLLRLLFHDCFVEGCDASVLIQGSGTERSDPANQSLGGFSVIDSAKRVLEIFCPGTVSCADILALAARDAVELTGGPNVEIPTGRKDGRISVASNVRPNIIDTSFTLEEMAKVFSEKGLSMDDLVTLSGAHTIGAAHCNSFNDRFKVDSSGNLTLIDSSLDRQYANQLTKMCPPTATDGSVTVSNDPNSPLLFDNQYYKILLSHKGLFQSDSALLNDARTRNRVMGFANSQESFFENWGVSFLKLSGVGVKTDRDGGGEIRQICSVPN